MDCSNCGNVLDAGAKHCNKCGAKQYDQHIHQPGMRQTYNQSPEMRQVQKQNPEMQQPFRQPPGTQQQPFRQPLGTQQSHNQQPATQQTQIQNPGMQQLGRQPVIQQQLSQNPEKRQLNEQRSGTLPAFHQNPEARQPDNQSVGVQKAFSQNPEMQQPYRQNPEFRQTPKQHPGVQQTYEQRPEVQQPFNQHLGAPKAVTQHPETPQQSFGKHPEAPQPFKQHLETTPQPAKLRPEAAQPLMQHIDTIQPANQRPETQQPFMQQFETTQHVNKGSETPKPLMHFETPRSETPQPLNQRPESFNQRPEAPKHLYQDFEPQKSFNQHTETPQQPYSHSGAPGTYYQNPEIHPPGMHSPHQTQQPYMGLGPNTYMPAMQPAASNKRRMSPFAIGILAGVIGICILLVAAIGMVGHAARSIDGNNADNVARGNNENNALTGNSLLPEQIYQNNVNGVFKIYATYESGRVYGVGSGFIVDAGGIAVTNHHVMVGASSAIAVLEDGTEINIVGYHSYDISNDLAVIQLDSRGHRFHYLTIGDSDAVRVGQTVYAIGSPSGDHNTFTVGSVSRFANEPISFDIYTIEGLIQMTAAIYGGSSGGVLLNDRGQVIGVNTAGNVHRASVGWAVPISRLVLPESGSNQVNPLPIEEPVLIRQEGIFTYERFPFIPDFLSVAANSSLIISGTAEQLGQDLVLDFDVNGDFHFSYAYMYDLENWSFLPVTDAYDEVLIEHGFIFQGVLNNDDTTHVLLYHEGENTTLAYCYYWDESVLLILIGEGNAYELFLSTPPEIPVGAVLDPNLIATWLFTQTSKEGYLEWMDDGLNLFYTFNEDGSGEFTSENHQGRTTFILDFVWYTENGSVVIEYYGFFTDTFVYQYRFVTQGLQMTDAFDRHVLERVE